ncbi:polysaccharide deacetylase family protein [Vibrio europaeus]|uniref:polysaccharide deacetylase family protein n=1 Tax=Vibrio europaeus TaxID=300876 RepID=UPI00233ED8C5|nr:polysaccharide deacetylase family protein [Vibrio europaeus]MDC5822029.1 polysaccharide deacetylase family protein [Vibrio europaeus]MDC5870125.1 polysaccharide deacetylase family protein [Vibrio europaeus]
MNILMALSQLEVTGAEVYATTVGNELTARGHNVHYVSDTLTKPFKGEFFKLRFNKRSIPRRFWHVTYLIYLIKKHKIQLVHAHSRASSWSCHVACKITGTPMVTTVHGRQPVHASRKKFHAMGDKALPVCEAIRDQLILDLGVSEKQLEVSRNGIETDKFSWLKAPENEKPIVTIIGRLSGPKGDLCYRLLNECLDTDSYNVKVVSGSQVGARFDKFRQRVNFNGYSNNVASILARSDLVIGAGRVAMESLLSGRPTLAIGEAKAIGLVDGSNIKEAMASNFGDIGPKDLDIDFSSIEQQVNLGLQSKHCYKEVVETIKENYSLTNIVDQVENIYQTVYVEKLRKEMPIIMYHRFIKDDSEKGIHGTYLHINMLEKHFKLIKKMGFETITFEDLANKGLISRLEYGKRYIIITVDDGYRDNYELLLPLLKKYNFKAVVYAVTGETFNRWDVENDDNPEKPVTLMNERELKSLSESGHIEVGGHTVSHPHLNTLSPEKQEAEIKKNKEDLENLLDKPLTSFAYPYGSLDANSKRITEKLGYQFAVATNSGPLSTHHDPFRIRRIAIFPRTDVFGLWRKIRGNYLFKKKDNFTG